MTSNKDTKQKQSVPTRSSSKPLKVPGYGLSIYHELGEDARFRHGAVDMDFDRMTVREVNMLRLIEALTDKPNWSKKVFDEAIVERWRKEALAMPLISQKTWDWCLEELQDKAKDFETTKLATVLDMGSRCVKTDVLVPTDLRDALRSAVKPLLDHTPRDWHPGSNDQVLNLVHPSLFPAIYGKTQVLPQKQIQLDDCLAPHEGCDILSAEAPGNKGESDAGNRDDNGNPDDNGHDLVAYEATQQQLDQANNQRLERARLESAEGPEGTGGLEDANVDDDDDAATTNASVNANDELVAEDSPSKDEMDQAFQESEDEDSLEALDFNSFDFEALGETGASEGGEGPEDPAPPPGFPPPPPGFPQLPLDPLAVPMATPYVFTWDPKERDVGNDKCWSDKFQWLPCDISFTNETNTSVAITSYINNLHPDKHRPLYHIIESFISLSIPAWNHILVTGDAGRTPLRIKANTADSDPPELPDWAGDLGDSESDEPFEARLAKVYEYWELPDNPDNEPFFEDIVHDWQEDLSIGVEWKFQRIRKTIYPEPGAPGTSYADWKAGKITVTPSAADEEFNRPPEQTTFEYKSVNIQDTFRDTGLQVIVKLASIELTPEKPSYAGGSWHIEGMLNEHIVATSIYYFDVENISESRIRFRQEAWLDQTKMTYAQNDHVPLCRLFGVDDLQGGDMIQELGSIATPDSRFLAFPNTLQHKVEPFGLADPTKPGHRRFLVLWLVDPNYRVLSTANVPPQQHEWWIEKAAEKVSGRVSREIQMMIEEQMKDGTITLEEAKEYRLELMAERTTFADAIQEGVRQYDFCEH